MGLLWSLFCSDTAGEGRWDAFCCDRLESLAFLLTRPSLIQSCCRASSGVIRILGSHLQTTGSIIYSDGLSMFILHFLYSYELTTIYWFIFVKKKPLSIDYSYVNDCSLISYSRHLLMKSRKLASHVLTACWRSLDPTRLFLPLLFVIHLGLPLESVKTKHNWLAITWQEWKTSRLPELKVLLIHVRENFARFMWASPLRILITMNQSFNVFCFLDGKHRLSCENKLLQTSLPL